MKVTKTFGMIASALLSGAMAMPVMAQTDPNAPGGAAGAAPRGRAAVAISIRRSSASRWKSGLRNSWG